MRISPNRVYLYLCTQEYLSCQPCPHISIQLVALYFDDIVIVIVLATSVTLTMLSEIPP